MRYVFITVVSIWAVLMVLSTCYYLVKPHISKRLSNWYVTENGVLVQLLDLKKRSHATDVQ